MNWQELLEALSKLAKESPEELNEKVMVEFSNEDHCYCRLTLVDLVKSYHTGKNSMIVTEV